ncbi:IclR family transcriptional regulator [Arthrobacter sp. HMWF013]|uniref:IclR family transcriptional regulator n=1 Tax=Arthrobacter sp. HMWF013 TaxID=2056849 RepID=UPI000D3CAC6F|nr:IclR family transcriptional regulator [Arthrobacter sp. HMWF013]PTT65629.1 IclR family transcriptional regulator [Arthrobacter sp. HMWF013]
MSTFAKAATILNLLAESRGRLTLTDLARKCSMPRSTVHRIIQELEAEHFVMQASSAGGYVLGPGVLKFGMNSHLQLVAAIRPVLISLAQEVNENVELAVFSGREVVVVDQVASAARLIPVTKVGKSFSLHGSCIGKILLAQLPDSRVLEILPKKLAAHTVNTITDVDVLLQELNEIRETNIAFDHEEHDLGISAAATCLRSPTGVSQAVAVVLPTHRFKSRAEAILEGLKNIQPNAVSRIAHERLARRGLG